MSPGARFMLVLAVVMCGTLVYFAVLEERKQSHECFLLFIVSGLLIFVDLCKRQQTDRCLHVKAVYCGERPERMTPLRKTRMVGGENVSVGIWPWHVSILHQPNSSVPFSQICGGAIVHKQWIMTAAACVNEKEGKLLIRAGSHSLDVDDESTQQSTIARIVRQKKLNPVTLRYNIALLKLKTPFALSEFVYPICVPDKAAAEHNFESCHITGYNVQPGDHFGVLQEARVFGLAQSLCNKEEFWDYSVAADMVCAGSFIGGVDGCEKNLGGPLNCYISIEHRYFIIGIRVKATSCGQPYKPNIYLKVSPHYWWIQHHIANGTH